MVILVTSCASEDSQEVTSEIKEKSIPITVTEAQVNTVKDSFIAIGDIEAKKSVAINTGAQATVEQVFVTPGDYVQEGDPLFLLESDNLKRNYSITQSQLKTQRDTLQLQLEDARDTYNNNLVLYEADSISKNVLAQSKSALDQTRKRYNDAVVAYNNQLSNLSDQLDDQLFKSPINGQVAAVYIESKESYNNTLAMEIIVSDEVFAVVDVTADQIDQLSVNDSVMIYSDGRLESGKSGTLTSINEIPNSVSGLYEVKVSLENKEKKFRVGEYIEAEFVTDQRKSITISKKSIQKNGEDYFVYVIEKNRSKEVPISIGLSRENVVEVLSGLEVGDRVALKGSSYLGNDSLVKVIEE